LRIVAWTTSGTGAQHVFVRRTEEGLYVKEMMIVESPTDRAWVGKKIGGGERASAYPQRSA
jgi:hypothetical protein